MSKQDTHLVAPKLFCQQCGYCVSFLSTNRCPECGRTFDPADAQMTSPSPALPVRAAACVILKWMSRAACVVFVGVGGFLVWLSHCWRVEQSTISSLVAAGGKVTTGYSDSWWGNALRSTRLSYLAVRAHHLTLQGRGVDTREITRISALSSLKSIRLQGTRTDDSLLAVVTGLPDLEELRLANTLITDAGLRHLTDAHRLRILNLKNTQITDVGLTYIAVIPHLEELYLEKTVIGDAGLAHLASLSQLRTLRVSETRVSDSGLMHLGRMQNLTSLDLSGTGIRGDGLRHIVALPKLTELFLYDTPIDDAALRPLVASRLRRLCLGHTRVTDAGMHSLASIHTLSELDLSETSITTTGLASLATLGHIEIHVFRTHVVNDEQLKMFPFLFSFDGMATPFERFE